MNSICSKCNGKGFKWIRRSPRTRPVKYPCRFCEGGKLEKIRQNGIFEKSG